MADLIYGNKWKVIDENYGVGGQSTVHKVQDVTDSSSPVRILKLFKNDRKRVDRFLSEIEACKRLKHPNIVNLIDHSALNDVIPNDKNYLVAEFASGGNLRDREKLYKGSVDLTIQVGILLADALKFSHENGIIHRDIKPENILFKGMDNECLISDFGICLIREAPRNTETHEVVGPRIFMAPELEDGGQLSVKPSADVYSLGKVIYFMFSGGVMFSREQLNDPKYDILNKTGQVRLLGVLLRKMICLDYERIQTMEEVIRELNNIKAWETKEDISPELKSMYEAVKIGAQKHYDEKKVNLENQEKRKNNLTIFINSITEWLPKYLNKLTEPLNGENTYEVKGRSDLFLEGNVDLKPKKYMILYQYGLSFQLRGSNNEHILDFLVLQPYQREFNTTDPTDTDYLIAPYYIVRNKMASPNQMSGVFNLPTAGLDRVTKSINNGYMFQLKGKIKEWPMNVASLEEFVQKTLHVFLARAKADEYFISP